MGQALVIGTGVIGAACALELARDGWAVTSVDRNAMAGHGSTSASSAMIRMHYSTWEGTAIAWEGAQYWKDWAAYVGLAAGTPLATFRQIGCLCLKHETNDNLTRHIELSTALGIPHEVWGPEALRARLPGIALERYYPAKRPDAEDFAEPTGGEIEGAVFWPDAGYVTDPALAAQNLLEAAQIAGARVVRAEVRGILGDGARVTGLALADGRELHADVVVNAAGPASSMINRMAGVTGDMGIGLRPLRVEVVHLPAPPEYREAAPPGVSDADIACYSRPEGDGSILVGSEDPPCDPHHWLDAVDGASQDLTEQADIQAMRYAQRMPEVGLPGSKRGIVGIYDASDDWIPIYDRSSRPGFYMACGTSGNQFKNAPVAGKLMAALIRYEAEGGDHDADPLTFRLDRTGVDLNAAFFSRRREINRDSSFSVLG
ncbi:MAG: FAD-dependent oxidoreductase [Pseudomonadota bacterium]